MTSHTDTSTAVHQLCRTWALVTEEPNGPEAPNDDPDPAPCDEVVALKATLAQDLLMQATDLVLSREISPSNIGILAGTFPFTEETVEALIVSSERARSDDDVTAILAQLAMSTEIEMGSRLRVMRHDRCPLEAKVWASLL